MQSGIVAYTCNPSLWETGGGGQLLVPGQPWLRVVPCLKTHPVTKTGASKRGLSKRTADKLCVCSALPPLNSWWASKGHHKTKLLSDGQRVWINTSSSVEGMCFNPRERKEMERIAKTKCWKIGRNQHFLKIVCVCAYVYICAPKSSARAVSALRL